MELTQSAHHYNKLGCRLSILSERLIENKKYAPVWFFGLEALGIIMKITHTVRRRASFITRSLDFRLPESTADSFPSREAVIGGIIKLNDLSVFAEVSFSETAKTPTAADACQVAHSCRQLNS
jgi:hypothetical protein